MKITLNWLKQYVDFDWSPAELADRLTMLGIEVEGVQKLSGEFEGIVVAEVLTRDKHPNADKLSLCRVNDGKGERQIVCGADNFKAGDKVALILPGATLPAKSGEAPLTIKVGKIRGYESQGMMCSPQELGLADDTQGLIILKPDAKLGQPFSEYLGRSSADVIYDLEITPNRPDLNSVIGVAREVSALTGNPLRLPQVFAQSAATSAEPKPAFAVRIEDAELCPRYTARLVRGVRIGPSPDWLRATLEKVGVRSISNVVDVTNFVMLETGQPLHVFDYHLLNTVDGAKKAPTIVVRRASDNEKFKTLDGQERTLTSQMLLIAEEKRAIALAGVMGGQNTEIGSATVDVLIESACFKPQNVRATSRRLELKTESSYRFERGSDVGICDWASLRAAHLILQTAGGIVAPGAVDAYPRPHLPKQITLRHNHTDSVLGLQIPIDFQIESLRRLGLEVVAGPGVAPVSGVRTPHSTLFQIPSFRVDLKREIDLIEEVARLYGVDKIPATAPRGATGFNTYDSLYDQLADARRILTGLGLNEAQGQTLISEAAANLLGDLPAVRLANPLSSDMNVLRPSLLPGLLEALRHNLSHKNLDVALFELSRVFAPGSPEATTGQSPAPSPAPAVAVPREQRRIAIALTGHRHATFWSGEGREAKFDLYDLKGLIEEFFGHFGIRGHAYARRAESSGLYLEAADIQLGRFKLGELGQLNPVLARRYDLRDPVMLAELDLDQILARRATARNFTPLPSQPSIRRDVAMLVPQATAHESVLQVVKRAKPANLESVELFDVFHGKNVPAGQKSVAYAFTYRHAERTLTDAEVNAAHLKLVEEIKRGLSATVRE